MAKPHYATKFQHPVSEAFSYFDQTTNAPEYNGFGEYNSDIGFYHLGDDYFVAYEDVNPIGNGYAVEMGYNDSFGIYLVIRHDMPNGDSIYSMYAHLDSLSSYIDPLQQVKEGVISQYSIDVFVSIDKNSSTGAIGVSGDTGHGGVHLHLEIADQNLFNAGSGQNYALGYDPASSPAFASSAPSATSPDGDAVLSPGRAIYDPSDFIDKYSNVGAVMRDFGPTGAPPGVPNAGGGTRTLVDFDDMFVFGQDPIYFDGYGYFADINGQIPDFFSFNFIAVHTPTLPEQDSGYVFGNTSGDWVAANGFGFDAWLENADGFDFSRANFTAAWRDGLVLTVVGYDLINGNYVESGTETIVLNTDAPVQWVFDNSFKDIERIEFHTSGGIQDPTLDGNGGQFVMDDVLIFI